MLPADYEVHLRLWALITDGVSAKKCNLVSISSVLLAQMAEIDAINVILLIHCGSELISCPFFAVY